MKVEFDVVMERLVLCMYGSARGVCSRDGGDDSVAFITFVS